MGNMAPPVNSVRQNSMKIPRVDDWNIYDTRYCMLLILMMFLESVAVCLSD